MVLGFFELPEDDQPPEEIWHHTERLEEWFKAVKQRRDNPDMKPIDEPMEESEMTSNSLTDEILGRS